MDISNDINKSLLILTPSANWELSGLGTCYADILWKEPPAYKCGVPKPSESEFNAIFADIDTKWEEHRFQQHRKRSYPSINDQLDQLYHDIDDGKFGENAKTGSWYVGITSIKNSVDTDRAYRTL